MTELTITCTFMNYPANDGRPVVQIGMSECPQEEARQFVLGPALTSQAEIDNQIDDLIRQLELARVEAKQYIEKMNPNRGDL